MVVKFNVGVFGQSFEFHEEAVEAFIMFEFAEFLIGFYPSVCVGISFQEGIHEIVPKGFVDFKCSTHYECNSY